MKEIIGSIYTGVSDEFQRGLFPIFRCLKAENHDLGVVEMEVIRLGNIYGEDRGTGFAGNVWDKNGICPTVTTMQGGMREPMIVDASAVRMTRTDEGKRLRKDYELGNITHGFNEYREMELRKDGVCNTLSTVQKDNYICEKSIVRQVGRNPESPTSRKPGLPTEQRLEPNSQGICNTLTSVQKDNMVLENFCIGGLQEHQTPRTDGISPSLTAAMGMVGGQTPLISDYRYRIRKLTPRECWRLMDFTDNDFEKAAAVNSQTQLYKQAGNSIIRNVLVAILGQLIEGKEDAYRKV